ncbi:MAG: hypothetical protein LM598_04720 [Candidatus Verstraetearchaeota archaeon]|nr:hypothetical protein [Candidatus Verstraetearchaeota archaeon]
MKLRIALILIAVALIIVAVPLYVYSSYPYSSSEEEAILEENVIEPMPFRPPRFLVGSVIYGSTREVVSIRGPMVEHYDDHLLIKFGGNKRGLLLLAPSYVETSTNKVVSGEHLAELISRGGDLTVKVVAFTTRRGSYAIVVEVVKGGERYIMAPQRR